MIWIILIGFSIYVSFILIELIQNKPIVVDEDSNGLLDSIFVYSRQSKFARFHTISICSIILIFLIFALISHIPRSVQVEFTGTEFTTGSIATSAIEEVEELQTVTIRIDGRMQSGIFGAPNFSGLIEIDAYDVTIGTPVSVEFRRTPLGDRRHDGWLRYWEFSEYTSDVWSMITMQADLHLSDARFTSFVISHWHQTQDDYQTLSRRIIVAPATNFDEANQIMEQINVSWAGFRQGIHGTSEGITIRDILRIILSLIIIAMGVYHFRAKVPQNKVLQVSPALWLRYSKIRGILEISIGIILLLTFIWTMYYMNTNMMPIHGGLIIVIVAILIISWLASIILSIKLKPKKIPLSEINPESGI